jgi:large subunit ribosomal protein L10
MPNPEKTRKVAALKERIEGSTALLLAEYRGLSVHDATELRRSLAEQARFSVVKNTLMQRAAGEAGIVDLEPLLTGPTAVAFVDGDVVAAAKQVAEASKRFPALALKGAYLDGQVLDAAAAQALATLESREVMLSKIAGMLKSEMSRAASVFQALQSRFVGLLEAYRDKLPAEEADASRSAVEPSGTAVSEPEAAAGEVAPAADTDAEANGEAIPAEGPGTDETGDGSAGGVAAAEGGSEDQTTREEEE